jgi:hypothetical protein
VRRLYGWTAGLVGIAALARLLAERRARLEARQLPPPAPAPDPAEELRRTLAASREADAPATAAPEPGEPTEPTESLEDRRARVHAKAQEALSAMDALEEPPA